MAMNMHQKILCSKTICSFPSTSLRRARLSMSLLFFQCLWKNKTETKKQTPIMIFCIFVSAAAEFGPLLHPTKRVFSNHWGPAGWGWMSVELQGRSERSHKFPSGGFTESFWPWVFGMLAQTVNVPGSEWSKFSNQPVGMAEHTGISKVERLHTYGSKS